MARLGRAGREHFHHPRRFHRTALQEDRETPYLANIIQERDLFSLLFFLHTDLDVPEVFSHCFPNMLNFSFAINFSHILAVLCNRCITRALQLILGLTHIQDQTNADFCRFCRSWRALNGSKFWCCDLHWG